MVVSLTEYGDEVDEVTPNALLLKNWNDLNGKRIGQFITDKCQEGLLSLPSSPSTLEFVTPAATLRSLSPECEEMLQNAKILLAVETSTKTSPYFNIIRESLVEFVRRNIEGTTVAAGLMNYGNTIEVTLDIGNYESTEELEETIQDMHSVGGDADSELAFKTARDLFTEAKHRDNLKFMIIVHATELR